MTKIKRECINIFYGSDYATLKMPTNCDYKTLVNVIRGICDAATATSTLAMIMSAMSEVMRGQPSVDIESGDSEQIRMVHVDKNKIYISFMGYKVKPMT